MSQMRYQVQVIAYQILDGAQVSIFVREVPHDAGEDVRRVFDRYFTAAELDTSTAAGWARDVLVAAIEQL